MNKTELIEAIQQVIIPNNQKAITAESLANLLTEIVGAMGEGSGNGMHRVWLHDAVGLDMTEEMIAENIASYNAIIRGETRIQLIGKDGDLCEILHLGGIAMSEGKVILISVVEESHGSWCNVAFELKEDGSANELS